MAYTVTISGGGIHEVIRDVVEHEVVGLPAATYHKMTMPNGIVLYYNDFGVRTVTVQKQGK